MKRSLLVFAALLPWVLTLGALSTASAWAAISASERQALTDLYEHAHGDAWVNRDNWRSGSGFSAPGTECTWHGITCDATGNHVFAMDLYTNNLVGQLPPTLNQLTGLTRLVLSHNQLSGPIPSLTGMAALQYFYVDHNQLSGSIPALNVLPALTEFHVLSNRLSGPIPSLDGMVMLQRFNVGENQLSGTPPAAPDFMEPDHSQLCPNLLHTPSASDDAWDTAIGGTWSSLCTPGYRVSPSAGPGGAVGPAQGVPSGDSATFLITPNQGMSVSGVNSSCGGTLTGNSFTTGPVLADCVLQVQFVGAAMAVPSLGAWSLALLGLLAAGTGAGALRRRS
jgi:hypothetical protein